MSHNNKGQTGKGERNSKMVFNSSASWSRQDQSRTIKSVNKHGVLDAAKALKEKHSKGQSAKMRKVLAEAETVAVDASAQQQKVSAIAKARGNVISDLRNLKATEAEVKQALYKQRQQQLRGKKTTGGQAKYALGDNDNGEMGQSMSEDVLTHGGKAIGEMTAAEFRQYDRGLGDSDDEDKRAIGKHETTAHFGGAGFDEQQFKLTRLSKEEWEKLSLPERYKFLIQMSKERKMVDKGSKSKAKDELSGLDAEYRDIMSMLDFSRGDDSDDEDIEKELKKADGLNGQSKEDYLQNLFDRYNISPDGGDDEDLDGDDDSDEDGDDDEDGEDEEFDEDDDETDENEDDYDAQANKLDSKLTSSTVSAPSKTFPTLIKHVEDNDDEDKYAKALGQSVAIPKIGLDGKAVGSSDTTLSSGLRIGSNAGRDDYTALTMDLKTTARQSASSRLISDQEKATRHRNYLLFLEERRIKRKSGDYDADAENELEKQYETLFMTRRALRKQTEKDEDALVVSAMMDGDDNDDDLDVSTGLKMSDDEDEDDLDEDGFDDEDDYDDEDGFDDEDMEFDEDDEEDEEKPVSKKSAKPKKTKASSGDSLDEDFLLDDEVGGIDYDDYDDDEIETMDVGGETAQLQIAKEKKSRFGKRSEKDLDRRDAQTRLARKSELGMFINDVDGVLQSYYLSTENPEYRRFIAKIKVTIRDEIPYNFEFPATFSEFISLYYSHLESIVAVYRSETTSIAKTITQLQSTVSQTADVTLKDQFKFLSEASLRGHVLSLILGRLFQLYHPRISPSNEARIEYLYRFLWRLMKVITQQLEYLQSQQSSPTQPLLSPPANKAYVVTTIHDVVAIADVITSYIFTINELLPRHTGRACIGLMELFAHAAKSPDVGQVLPNPEQEREVLILTKTFGQKVVILPPAVHELFAYKLLMQLYPLSDARHTIMTPLQLLLVQSVTQCYISSNTDMTRMVFLMGLLMEIWRSSDKYVPEVVAALQSLIALLSNSFIPTTHMPRAQQQYTKPAPAPGQSKVETKPRKNQQPQSPSTPFQWTPIMLESWRECPCAIAPGTLNTINTLPKEFVRQNNRTSGLLPLHWLTASPLIQQQSQTEYFRYAMLATIASFVSSLVTNVKGMKSTNEVLQPILQSLKSLIQNMAQYLEAASSAAAQKAEIKAAPVKEDKKKKKGKGEEELVSLTNTSTDAINKYTELHTKLVAVVTQAEHLATNSLIGRKPLEKYAAVILQKELEPRLDIDNKYNPSSQKQKAEDEIAERKRLKKKLADQEKTMRKQIKATAFSAAVEQHKLNAERDEARKAKLTRARQIVQGDANQDLQNRRNFKKQKR